MDKKTGIIIFVLLTVFVFGIFVVVSLLDGERNLEMEISSIENGEVDDEIVEAGKDQHIFRSTGIRDNNWIQYVSIEYDFAIDIPREFYCSLSPEVLWGGNTVYCLRPNSNSSNSQDDPLFIEIFSTGYDYTQKDAFENWYKNGIEKYYARQLDKIASEESLFTLTHETTTGGIASYVYFPTKETVLTIGSTVVSEEEILEIANSFHWKDESQISNINNNLNSSTNDEWITFTADEIDLRLSYPGNWKKYYDYSEDYGFTLELESNIQVYNVDPLTNQGAEGPLIEFRVNSQPNFENYVLSDWVSHSSAVEDEQERIRKDIQGYMGYTQWIWHQSNPFAFSSINYYVDVNDEIWEFRASINDDNPESEQFIKSKKIIEQIFESIEFTD